MSRIAAIILACLLATPAAAETHDLGETVAGHPGVTYADLLKQLVPDLKQDDDAWRGTAVRNYRHLLGKESDNGPPDAVTFTGVEIVHARESGSDRLILLTENSTAPNEWFAMLAAFDNAPKPRLLDAANIAADQFNGFFTEPVLKLANGSDAIFVTSTHSNSNQAHAIVTAATLRGGKLQKAFDIFTLDSHACTFNRTQELTFAARGSDIAATVVETTAAAGEDCGEDPTVKPGKQTWQEHVPPRSRTGSLRPNNTRFRPLG